MGMYGMVTVTDTNNIMYENGPRFTKSYNLLASDGMRSWWDNPISPGPFHLYEADYFQYSQGLMTDSVWQAKLHAMEVNLKGCTYPEIYEMRAELVEGEFKSVLDNMPSQCTE